MRVLKYEYASRRLSYVLAIAVETSSLDSLSRHLTNSYNNSQNDCRMFDVHKCWPPPTLHHHHSTKKKTKKMTCNSLNDYFDVSQSHNYSKYYYIVPLTDETRICCCCHALTLVIEYGMAD